MKVLDIIEKCKVIPVIVIDDASNAVKLAQTLSEGGLNCIEITLRTEQALEAIKKITEKCPHIVVGAGTVLSTEQVDMAVEAGAKFIVSPGSNKKVIQYCKSKDIVIIPGVMTPTEIEKNLELGISVMKFFPAEAAGGINFINAVSAPYDNVRFMPTGGINMNNVMNYLENKKIIACGGSWMATKDMINQCKWDDIRDKAMEINKLWQK